MSIEKSLSLSISRKYETQLCRTVNQKIADLFKQLFFLFSIICRGVGRHHRRPPSNGSNSGNQNSLPSPLHSTYSNTPSVTLAGKKKKLRKSCVFLQFKLIIDLVKTCIQVNFLTGHMYTSSNYSTALQSDLRFFMFHEKNN